MASMLVGLETLKVIGCEQMETIITRDQRSISEIEFEEDVVNGKDGEESTNKIVFPKLRSIKFSNLKRLHVFNSQNITLQLPLLTTLKIEDCSIFDFRDYFYRKAFTLVNLETLDIGGLHDISCIVNDQMPIGSLSQLRTINVKGCDDLHHVAVANSIKLLQSLEELKVWECKSLEAVFDFRCIYVEGVPMESLLDRLQSVSLNWLPSFKHIWKMLPKEIHVFKNLRSLDLEHCNNLRYLLSPPMAKMLVGLETLDIYDCDAMEAVIGRDESVPLEVGYEEDTVKKKDREESADKIQFPKLRSLSVQFVEKFQMLCSENIDLQLPSLIELEIGNWKLSEYDKILCRTAKCTKASQCASF